MNIEAFLLCDCATDSAGKLNVLGAFDSIYAKMVPVVHPACTLAVRARFSKIEEGEHKIRVDIIDADGKAVVPRLDGKVSVQIRGEANSAVANLILNLQRIKLERYGEYRIDLAIDGEQRGALPFNVRELPDKG